MCGYISSIIKTNIGLYIKAKTTGSALDSDAAAFITTAGITDTTQKNAINNLVLNMKDAGIWTKMKAIYPFVGGTDTTHKWNLKDPRDLDAAFRLVFSGGWTHTSTGATPNGINAYANTFLNSATHLSLNSGHMSYYSRTNNPSATIRIDMGSLKSSPDSYTDLDLSNQSNTYFRFNNGISYNLISSSTTLGFFNGNRTAINVINLFRNGTKVISGNATSNATSSANYFIGASNNHGVGSTDTPQYFSNRECAFASIGDGLTDSESLAFNQIVETYQYELNRNVNPVNANYYSTAYNPETNTFLYASEITDDTQKTAVDTLITDLKTAGIWTKMKAIYPFVGGSSTTHKWNLKDPQDLDAAFRLVFNGGWTHSSTGALPNGANGYANSFLSTSAISLNSVHISYYSRTNNTSIGCEIGGGNSSPDSYTLLQGRTHVAPTTDTAIWINNTVTVDRVAGVDTAAFFCGSRTANNVIKLFRNSSIIINGTANSNTTSTFPIWLGAFNFAGSGSVWSNRECAFASIGDGLTDTEAEDFYTAVQTYQTTLSRQV